MPNTVGTGRLYPMQSPHREVEILYCKLTFASSGTAYTIVDGADVISVARSAAGVIVLHLRRAHARLLGYSIGLMAADGNGPLVTGSVAAEAVSTASDPTVTIKFADAFSNDGTFVDPEDGDTIFVTLHLADSTISGR